MNIDGYQFKWINNEPVKWSVENPNIITVITENNTDFWKDTWYGFNRFTGHVFGCNVSEIIKQQQQQQRQQQQQQQECKSESLEVDDISFTFQLKVNAEFSYLYDQAGVIVIADESHWIKAGIEYNDDHPCMGSVLTLGKSDWATAIYQGNAKEYHMRITMINKCLRVQYSSDGGKTWPLLRLSPFEVDSTNIRVGLYCCTPERQGLQVIFSNLQLSIPAFIQEFT
ncbi:hypothetical protein PPL_08576 [Heterostelium album PN500]|uniref:Uncharacterized protein n=1 Tax=Heterostelium pallidum (strain ATCC 26659 / Pp 5 / PN500) TaxID=670386 RepID=D3BJ51_HETP5|nr:hypothetical protein PPL_08576 [Heterostelium album PN500]EFA77931.1 hypothetical protein PPL_08576 [Heterostelium album PN500]|eukprot:XP_020430059.1 hypothetical protein PPL_08576 [Heterostelium album PN500]